MRSIPIAIAISLLLSLDAGSVSAQLPFFSGAEGYGGSFSGAAPAGGWFSNATVYHVTNLNDSGAGSLRGAFQENSSNKIIVFDVAGTIQLTSGKLDIKNLSNYYIAGQTAPGPVTVYGDMTQITHSNDKDNTNVVLRYMTFRKGTNGDDDAITISGGNGVQHTGRGSNMILDHVSASWSEDEVLSVANNNTNITVQYSMIHDALVNGHAYGSLIRPRIDSNVSFHHNLYANNASRQARFGTYYAETLTADFRNNVVYNWRDRASYAGGSSEPEREAADVNYVGNYLIAGPGTGSNTTRAFYVDENIDARVYQSGNFIDSDKSVNSAGTPNGADTGWGMFFVSPPPSDEPERVGVLTQMGSAFVTPAVTTQSAVDAYWQVVNHAGNHWWNRGAIDSRVIGNVLNNTNAPNGIGANAPNAAELNGLLTAPLITRPAGWDSDNDGMPDEWELAHLLNPNSPGGSPDWKLDFDNDGYINLLEYVNEAGEFPAPAPIVFNGTTNGRYAQISNWKTYDGGITAGSNWQPSKYDEAQINNGTVVVDSVGQHAGLLLLGANAGDNATLNISSGWLMVADAIVIGGDDAATAAVNLSGGMLSAPTLAKGAGGAFNFMGGILHAENIGFDLVNLGGTFAPGNSIGDAHIMGDLELAGGSLEIEISSAALSDTLLVTGDVTVGGDLDVALIDGFSPTSGDSWQIATANSITGAFSSITPGYNVQKQGNNLILFFGSALSLAGDYNDDGVVDAADYVVWRATDGTPDGYNTWRANFGASSGGGSGRIEPSGVPEPTTVVLVLATSIALIGVRGGLRNSGRFLQE